MKINSKKKDQKKPELGHENGLKTLKIEIVKHIFISLYLNSKRKKYK